MKNIFKLTFTILAASMLFAACDLLPWDREEKLDPESVFSDNTTLVENQFDRWLQKNFVEPYNIQVKYRFEDKESDTRYNVTPAKIEKSIALAKIVKFLWLESYEELLGEGFIRTMCPKVLNFVGSPEYDNGSVVLGTADSGMKITLFNINSLDLDNLNIEDLNYWYFHTMHHEFAHILHQTKNYSTDFNLISKDYQGGSWVNLSGEEALKMGFITNYGSSEPNEDFVEIISTYVTHTPEWWTKIVAMGVNKDKKTGEQDGADKINAKLDIVKDYLKSQWSIDIDQLRDIVLRRSELVLGLDLTL